MKAEQLIKLLQVYPDAKIKVWGGEEVKAKITEENGEMIIDIRKK